MPLNTGRFHHIDFSNYQFYSLTPEGLKSDYLTCLFDKVFEPNDSNTFYSAYKNGVECPHHKSCPVRHNFEFLMQKGVRKLLIQRVIEACVKDKLVVTTRDILNFLFDALVSPSFDENTIWDKLANHAQNLEAYISCATPTLLFANRGTSSLIDHLGKSAAGGETTEDCDRDALEFYALDVVASRADSALKDTAYSWIIKPISEIDDSQGHFRKYLYKFLKNCKKLGETADSDELYLSFTQDLYYAYALKRGKNKDIGKLKDLYNSVKRCIFAWNGFYGDGLVCLDDSSDDYSILEELEIKPDFDRENESESPLQNADDAILRFLPVIPVRFQDATNSCKATFSIDFGLYRIIKAMQEGYCPTSQDRNIHADFSSGVRRISEFGSKKTRVLLISKRQGDDARFSFEKDDFGYSFKKE